VKSKQKHTTTNKKRDRESFTHAWPHLCTADPSKDGDQNIPKVLAPKMKTEEQQQHKIKREAKKNRKKSRREKERERRKGELLKEPFREAPSGLIEYFIGMG
jgi:hypothetical protein